jgi:hypothetical protein
LNNDNILSLKRFQATKEDFYVTSIKNIHEKTMCFLCTPSYSVIFSSYSVIFSTYSIVFSSYSVIFSSVNFIPTDEFALSTDYSDIFYSGHDSPTGVDNPPTGEIFIPTDGIMTE